MIKRVGVSNTKGGTIEKSLLWVSSFNMSIDQ